MIIQVPGINGLGKTHGCELTPGLICKKFKLKSGIINLDYDNIDLQEKEIYENAKKIIDSAERKKEKVLFTGGDHSISYPIGKAFIEKFGNSKILVFDAHFDLMKPMENPTHEEWLRALIEDKKFRDILLLGIRRKSINIDKREIEFARKNKIKIIYSDEFEQRKNEIFEFCKKSPVYISIDADVFDDSLVNAVAYPEKNGIKCDLSELIKKIENVKLIDLVELNNEKGDFKKAFKLVEKIIKWIK